MKVIAIAVLTILTFTMGLCVTAQASGYGGSPSEWTDSDIPKSLVVFYSYSHNTESVAKRVAYLLGADIYQLQTVKAYPDDPYKTSDISKQERNSGKLPKLTNDLPNISKYDVIFIGGPIWNGLLSTPLKSYLEQTDFTGKQVIPFSTSVGTGRESYLDEFKNSARNPQKIGEYKDIRFPGNGHPDAYTDKELDEKLKDWLNQFGKFDFQSKTVKLNSGHMMPILGLGTWTLTDDVAKNAVYCALKEGYRLIDTAQMYGNEEDVGKGVRQAIAEGIVTREEIFITTKLVPWGDSNYDAAIVGCNERLGLGYIDLLLIHQQGSGERELYQAIERAIEKGIVRSLGISNYYTPEAFQRVTAGMSIMPAIVQNENHPFYQNTAMQQYVSQFRTVMESYYPFGGRGHTQDLFNNATIVAIAKAHRKTSAQVLARWHLQAGYIAIPGSSNPKHIAENYAIFDFELTNSEMAQIADLNTGERYENW